MLSITLVCFASISTIVISLKSPPMHSTPFFTKISSPTTPSSVRHARTSTTPCTSLTIPLPPPLVTTIASPVPPLMILLPTIHTHLFLTCAANHHVSLHLSCEPSHSHHRVPTSFIPTTTSHRTCRHHQNLQSPWLAAETAAALLNHCRYHFPCSTATTNYAAHSMSSESGGGAEGCGVM